VGDEGGWRREGGGISGQVRKTAVFHTF